MIKLIAVEPQGSYKLLLRFSDGRRGVCDFGHFVDAATEMTAPLGNPDYFGSHFIEAGALAWPNGFDLSAHSLYERLRDEGQLHRGCEAVGATMRAQTHHGPGLRYLQDTARNRKNVFAALMQAVKTHSLGQISHALYDVGSEYRRNM